MQTLRKCLIMTSPKHSITATIEDNVIYIIISGQEIHTVLSYHYFTYRVLPDPLLIALYVVLATKTLKTSNLGPCLL